MQQSVPGQYTYALTEKESIQDPRIKKPKPTKPPPSLCKKQVPCRTDKKRQVSKMVPTIPTKPLPSLNKERLNNTNNLMRNHYQNKPDQNNNTSARGEKNRYAPKHIPMSQPNSAIDNDLLNISKRKQFHSQPNVVVNNNLNMKKEGRDRNIKPKQTIMEQIGKEVCKLTNKLRATKSLSELKWDQRMSDLATGHSQNMAQRDAKSVGNATSVGHDGFKIRQIKYLQIKGENAATVPVDKGYRNIATEAVYMKWKYSKGHFDNLVRDEFTCIGVGVWKNDTDYYLTQLFG